jgi:tetratricopeptide (TPR) repeat protein
LNKVVPTIKYLAFHLYNKEMFEEALALNVQLLKVLEEDASLYNSCAFLCREMEQYEESYSFYRKALDLDPTNPSYLNDTALILHYHLHRDLDKAEEMYEEAIAKANLLLEEKGLNQAKVEEIRVALQDAKNNLRRLKAGILEVRNMGEMEPLKRPKIGISVRTREEGKPGLEVIRVVSGSAAEKTGIQKGDVLLSVDGESVNGMSALITILRKHKPGDMVKVKYLRGDQESEVAINLGN